MPANLTPQYQKAEEEFRRAQSPSERLEILERMLVLIPKHKGTEKLQADLKTKLKETKEELQAEKSAPKAGPKSFRIPRQGAATLVLIGAPNAGKSRIVKELTNAEPVVADYPFSTREPLPGMMKWNDVVVQLVDTPPITADQFEPYLINMARSADAVVLVFDGSSDDAPDETAAVIEQLRRRHTELAAVTGFDEDDFSRLKVRSLLVVTRGGDPDAGVRLDMFREQCPVDFPAVVVNLEAATDVERLRNELFARLDLMRIYTKAPGKPADRTNPFVIPIGGSVEDLAYKVHRELAEKLKFAKVWGTGVTDGQSVGRDHGLSDGDLVELHA